MENLDTLPQNNNTILTQEEEEVLNMFGSKKDSSSNKQSFLHSTKFCLYASILFLLLANPWVDPLFEKLPWCGENKMFILGVKAVIFFLGIALLKKFAL